MAHKFRSENARRYAAFRDSFRASEVDFGQFNARYMGFQTPAIVDQALWEIGKIENKLPTRYTLDAAKKAAPIRFKLGRYEEKAKSLTKKVTAMHTQLFNMPR